MIKLIAIDLDGTLLTSDKKISQKNLEAIKYAQEKGVKVVIATGRPLNGIKDIINKLTLLQQDDYTICFNGGIITNNKTEANIFQSSLSYEDLLIIYNEAKRLNTNIHAFKTDQSLITPKMSYGTEIEKNINNLDCEIIDFTSIDKTSRFIKVMLVGYEDEINRVVSLLNPDLYNKYMINRSSKIFLEFMDLTTNKGLALDRLAKHLNIKDDEIMAIGDAENDLAMIKKASIGVAMQNAIPKVIEVADFITLDNDNDGVAHAIYHFIK